MKNFWCFGDLQAPNVRRLGLSAVPNKIITILKARLLERDTGGFNKCDVCRGGIKKKNQRLRNRLHDIFFIGITEGLQL
jgi:hypothetical protein